MTLVGLLALAASRRPSGFRTSGCDSGLLAAQARLRREISALVALRTTALF